MSVIINGDTGITTPGVVNSAAETIATTLSVTGAITGSSTVAGSTGILYPLVSGTAVATTSGTSIDFTGIPSWVKRITVMFNGVSTSGGSDVMIQIGAGSIINTGYLGNGTRINGSGFAGTANSTGFRLEATLGSVGASIRYGSASIFLVTTNTYGINSNYSVAPAESATGTGTLALSGALDRIRLTTVNGTDTFDAGSVNILYE